MTDGFIYVEYKEIINNQIGIKAEYSIKNTKTKKKKRNFAQHLFSGKTRELLD